MRAQLCSNRSTNLLDIGTSRHHDSCRGYEILEYPLLRTAEPLAASLAQTPYLRSRRQRPLLFDQRSSTLRYDRCNQLLCEFTPRWQFRVVNEMLAKGTEEGRGYEQIGNEPCSNLHAYPPSDCMARISSRSHYMDQLYDPSVPSTRALSFRKSTVLMGPPDRGGRS